jgi:hypothetical protein
LGCAEMAPVVSVPPEPFCLALEPGEHTVFVRGTTIDRYYHVESFYQFIITCGSECDPSTGEGCNANFSATQLDVCHWELEAEDDSGTCSWVAVIESDGCEYVLVGSTCTFDLDLEAAPERMPRCICGAYTATVTLTTSTEEGGTCSTTQIFNCGCELTETAWSPGVAHQDNCTSEPEVCDQTCEFRALIYWPETDSCGNPLYLAYLLPGESSCDADPTLCDEPDDAWLDCWHTAECLDPDEDGICYHETPLYTAAGTNHCIRAFLYRDNCCIGPEVTINLSPGCGPC